MKVLKVLLNLLLALFIAALAVLLIYLFAYNWGWRIGGFSNCVSPERYYVMGYARNEDNISILYEKGGMYCTPIIGYISEQQDHTLKIGIKYYNDYTAYINKGTWVEELVIPCDGDSIEKIVFCGDGDEADISEIYRPDIWETYFDYYPQFQKYVVSSVDY